MYISQEAVSFFNSQFFVALVTLVVGLFAILLYLRQKRDRKSDAASLILQEIRYAEAMVRVTRDHRGQFKVYDRLLPTNSWNNNIHLFLGLEETELDLISRFYSKVAYIDILLGKISDFKNQSRQNPMQQVVITQPQIIQPQPMINPQLQNQIQIFDPMETTQVILEEVCGSLEPVYNTPTGEKLKRLARREPIFLFF